MSQTNDDRGRGATSAPEADSGRGLFGLGLTSEDLDALRRQGFVSEERRGDRRRFKLRYRRGGTQQVRYLGVDPEVAWLVRKQLAELQRRRAAERKLTKAAEETRRALRDVKQALEPALADRGYYFHGRAVRRRRDANGATDDDNPSRLDRNPR